MTAFTMLKMAVFMPRPMASVSTAMAVKPGSCGARGRLAGRPAPSVRWRSSPGGVAGELDGGAVAELAAGGDAGGFGGHAAFAKARFAGVRGAGRARRRGPGRGRRGRAGR